MPLYLNSTGLRLTEVRSTRNLKFKEKAPIRILLSINLQKTHEDMELKSVCEGWDTARCCCQKRAKLLSFFKRDGTWLSRDERWASRRQRRGWEAVQLWLKGLFFFREMDCMCMYIHTHICVHTQTHTCVRACAYACRYSRKVERGTSV